MGRWRIVQEHTLKAFDGLAPAGTISPVRGHHSSDADDDNRAVLPRVGVLFNSSPTRVLYVSEPFENSIAALHLATTERFFTLRA
ncbi:MAG: hypothetical protein KGM92_09800 [Acidobacteriota bacterium]|nr:hypothetical protein [Acidobacteriota bacterium]